MNDPYAVSPLQHWQIPRLDPALEAGYRTNATIREMMSGHAVFTGMEEAVERLRSTAPEDHDVAVHAYNILVADVRFIEPHTFVFEGFDGDGHRAIVIVHYSQLVAHVISRPKIRPERIITGFAPIHSDSEENEEA